MIPNTLRTGNTTTDRMSAGTLGGYSPVAFTWAAWVSIHALTNSRQLFAKQDGGDTTNTLKLTLSGTSGDVGLHWSRATSEHSFITTDTPFAILNIPYFVAVTTDQGLGTNYSQIYVGTLTSPPAARAGTQTDGSGSFNQPFGSYVLAASVAGTGSAQSISASFWQAWFFDEKVLTLAEISMLYNGRLPYHPKCVHRPGMNGVGSLIPDLSGNGFFGTNSGGVPTNEVLPRGVTRPKTDNYAFIPVAGGTPPNPFINNPIIIM